MLICFYFELTFVFSETITDWVTDATFSLTVKYMFKKVLGGFYVLCWQYATFYISTFVWKKKLLCKTMTLRSTSFLFGLSQMPELVADCRNGVFVAATHFLRFNRFHFFYSTLSQAVIYYLMKEMFLRSKASSYRVLLKSHTMSQVSIYFGINSDYWEWQSGTRGTWNSSCCCSC